MQGQKAYHRQPMGRSGRSMADSQRMHISMNDGGREADWYGRGAMGVLGLGVTGSLHQPVTDRYAATREVPLVSTKGVRATVGHVCIALVIFVLGVMTIMNLMDLKTAGDRVYGMRRDITSAQEELARAEQELVAKAKEVNVGYEAAKLGMVSAKSVKTIYITLPEVVPMTLTAEVNTVEGDLLAAIPGD